MPHPLTDVSGIGPAAAALLTAAGIKTAEDLADASVAEISAVKTFGPARAALVKEAASTLIKAAAKPAEPKQAKNPTKSSSVPAKASDARPQAAESKPDKKKKKDKDAKKAKDKAGKKSKKSDKKSGKKKKDKKKNKK